MKVDASKYYSDGMYINSDGLRNIIVRLRQKIDSIKQCYSDLNKIVRDLDGSNDNWQGDNQKKFYNIYTVLSSEYEPNVEKLEEFYEFLCKVVADYEKREKDSEKEIDDNEDNLDVV